jgi:hypothetical protein
LQFLGLHFSNGQAPPPRLRIHLDLEERELLSLTVPLAKFGLSGLQFGLPRLVIALGLAEASGQVAMAVRLGIQAGLQAGDLPGPQFLADQAGKPFPLLISRLPLMIGHRFICSFQLCLGMPELVLPHGDNPDCFLLALTAKAEQITKIVALH